MKIFINLTSRVINKLHIIEIIKKPNKYFICMNEFNIGEIQIFPLRKYNIIEICEKDNNQDYVTIREFIKNN